MMVDIEMIVNDLLYHLKEQGVNAEVAYCLNRSGDVVSFEIKILSYNDWKDRQMSGHTKGEWKWEGNIEPTEDKDGLYRGTASTWLSGPNGEPILVPWDYESYSCGLYISEANARLIAAAPKLLAACEYTIEKLRGVKDKAFPIIPIITAIAAAKGD